MMRAIRRKLLIRSRVREHEPEHWPEVVGLLATSFHEAAHVVFGALLGFRLIEVRFDRGTLYGATAYRPAVRCVLLDLAQTLAGPIAENLIVVDPPDRDHASSTDFDEARTLALKFLGMREHDPGAPAAVVDLLDRVQTLVRETLLEDRRVASAVDVIAADLLTRGKMTRAQIQSAIDKSGARRAVPKLRAGLEAIRAEQRRELEAAAAMPPTSSIRYAERRSDVAF